MKKLISLVLALCLVALCGLAFASETPAETLQITIKSNAEEGTVNTTEYDWYQIMKADYSGDLNPVTEATGESSGTAAVAYYVENETLATLLNATAYLKATRVGTTNRWNIEKVGTPTGEQLAESLNTKEIKEAAIASGSVNADGTNDVVITAPSKGYYLIVASNGTKLAAQTLGDVTIKEKNNYPGNTKTEDKSNAEIGEVVTYTVTVTIPRTVAEKDIVVVDTATKGLTMNTAITVTGAGTTDAAALTALTFSLDSTDATTQAKTYKAIIPAAKVIANAGSTLTLTYTATVNELAVVNVPEVNKARIEYDNFKTVDVEVQELTFGFDLLKVDGANADIKLEGVVFTLTNEAGEYYTEPTDTNDKDEDRFKTAEATIATAAGGTYTFAGLHEGVYTLTEISNPNPGYNLLTSPITITMGEDGKISYSLDGTNTTSNAVSITVANNKGAQLPSTGGIGTTIFYILGGLLVVGAAVILIARRKAQD